MKISKAIPMVSCLLILAFALSSCSFSAVEPTSTPAPTDTPAPSATNTATPTNTPLPSPTPRPTKTPDLAATQKVADINTQTQNFIDLGYLPPVEGEIVYFKDFSYATARMTSYYKWYVPQSAKNFYMSGHFKWSSAYRNAQTSGCGFVFAGQSDGDHYAVFLDRSRVYFVETANRRYRPLGITRGTDRVSFENPFDHPVEADFTLIVNDAYAYVLLDGELVGEYTLAQSKNLDGVLGYALLSGTNKDFGTRCEITNFYAWIPN